MHTNGMAALLEAGANPEMKDNTGKDVVQLVDNLRSTMPLNASMITRRIALENVSSVLTERIFEEVHPSQVTALGRFSVTGLCRVLFPIFPYLYLYVCADPKFA